MKGMYKFIKEVSTELSNELEEKAESNQDFEFKVIELNIYFIKNFTFSINRFSC